MATMRMVAEQPEGPRTTEGNDKEQGYKDLYITNARTREVHVPLENLDGAWIELYSHLRANNLQ